MSNVSGNMTCIAYQSTLVKWICYMTFLCYRNNAEVKLTNQSFSYRVWIRMNPRTCSLETTQTAYHSKYQHNIEICKLPINAHRCLIITTDFQVFKNICLLLSHVMHRLWLLWWHRNKFWHPLWQVLQCFSLIQQYTTSSVTPPLTTVY